MILRSVFVILCGILLFGNSPPVFGLDESWIIEQVSPFTGKWKLSLSNNGVDACNSTLGTALSVKGPKWHAVASNHEAKTYFSSPITKWDSPITKYGDKAAVVLEKTPRKLRDGTVLGHKTSLFLSENIASKGLIKIEVTLAPDIETPKELEPLFCKIYGSGIAKQEGFPLQVSYINEMGKRIRVLETVSITSGSSSSDTTVQPDFVPVDAPLVTLLDHEGRETMAKIVTDNGTAERFAIGNPKDSAKSANTNSVGLGIHCCFRGYVVCHEKAPVGPRHAAGCLLWIPYDLANTRKRRFAMGVELQGCTRCLSSGRL